MLYERYYEHLVLWKNTPTSSQLNSGAWLTSVMRGAMLQEQRLGGFLLVLQALVALGTL